MTRDDRPWSSFRLARSFRRNPAAVILGTVDDPNPGGLHVREKLHGCQVDERDAPTVVSPDVLDRAKAPAKGKRSVLLRAAWAGANISRLFVKTDRWRALRASGRRRVTARRIV